MRYLTLSLAFVLAACASAAGQPPNRPQPQERSPRDQVNGGFERNAPDLGEQLPDVELYTADGKPVNLKDLRGSYSVLVFGCLT